MTEPRFHVVADGNWAAIWSIRIAVASPFVGWGWGIGAIFLGGLGEAGIYLWLVGLLVASALPPVAVALAHISFVRGGWRPPLKSSLAAIVASYAATAIMLASWVFFASLGNSLAFD